MTLDLLPKELVGAYPAIKDSLLAFAPTIRKSAASLTRALVDRTIATLQIGFAPYLNASYTRCASVKTLLSQDKPLELLSIYVNLNLKCRGDVYKDNDLINSTQKYSRMIVTGLAGSGKSLFLKYWTVCKFHNPSGVIPLFVELRNLNSLKSRDLLAYIHSECASADNRITYQQFEFALQAGGIILLLDGFDEVDFSHRDNIGQQIISIAKKYPAARIVLSSRPDDKFGGWSEFYIFSVCPLTKIQALELIEKIDYDEGLKNRFKEAINTSLFTTHESFLSSPLLCSIMLLTYEQFAEIPSKVHIFYDQAFTALFRRFDATKAQFIRKTYANLALDDFRGFFAAFCAFSYLEEKFSFYYDDLWSYTTEALKFSGLARASTENVTKDLLECVCMLQKDGLYTTFAHRSFQEYFSAVFLSAYNGPLFQPLIDKCAIRSRDQVLPMLFEMARDRLDRDWTLPKVDDILNSTDDTLAANSSVEIYSRLIELMIVEVFLAQDGALHVRAHDCEVGVDYIIWQTIYNLHRRELASISVSEEWTFHGIAQNYFLNPLTMWLKNSKTGHFSEDEIEQRLKRLPTSVTKTAQDDGHHWRLTIRFKDPRIVESLNLCDSVQTFYKELESIKSDINQRLSGQDTIVRLLIQQQSSLTPPLSSQNRRKRRPSV